MMRRLFAVLTLMACTPDEQRTVWRNPVKFVLADADVDSSSIRITVVDDVTGTPVQATLCLDAGLDSAVVVDETGVATVRALGSGNLSARVLAPHYDSASLIFQLGRRGRMQANIRLTPNGAASATPSCSIPTS